MSELKWYQKLLIGLAIVVFSPLILTCIIITGVYLLFQIPKDKKKYKASHYYSDFKKKFMIGISDSPEYRFYNSAVRRNLPIQYIRQESNGFEYFIFNDMLFLFPDFEQIDYDTEKEEWQADFDGNWANYDESYKNLFAKLDKEPNIPVKLLVERGMFPLANLNAVHIPENIYVTWGYDEAFINEESPLKMVIPQTSKELYEMMLQTPDLCGYFEFLVEDGNIIWDLHENIRIEISVDQRDSYISVSEMRFGKVKSSITHWHPTPFEVYNEICKIGKIGNVSVIRKFMSGANVLYMGNKQDCPYKCGKANLFGKLYYLEAKP